MVNFLFKIIDVMNNNKMPKKKTHYLFAIIETNPIAILNLRCVCSNSCDANLNQHLFVELTHELDCGTSTLLEYQSQN